MKLEWFKNEEFENDSIDDIEEKISKMKLSESIKILNNKLSIIELPNISRSEQVKIYFLILKRYFQNYFIFPSLFIFLVSSVM